MKAISNHFTNRLGTLPVFGLLLAVICLPADAKNGVNNGYRYENVYDSNFWLTGKNVVGMREDTLTISQAAVRGAFEFNDWNVGADARTILHLDKFSMAGSFSFDQKTMYDACGSMFLDPGRFPVDMMEFTPGTKSRQRYAFTGGISVDLGSGWALGGQIDYSATNYTKRKDLRYSDFAMDLSFRPGVVWRSGDLALGLALRLDRNTETVKAEQIGASAQSYYAFLNKGLFFGLEQVWDSEILHLSESGINNFPVKNIGYGAALELGYGAWFLELSYLYGNGEVGEKDAIWYKFPSHKAEATLAYRWSKGKTRSWVRLDGSFLRDALNEAVIEKTTEGGVVTRSTYGFNNIRNLSSIAIVPSFKSICPGRYEIGVKAGYTREDSQSSLKYPAVVGESLSTYEADVLGKVILGRWDIIAGCGITGGSLNSRQNVEEASLPYRQEEYYQAWKNFSTSLRLSAQAGLRHTFKNHVFIEALYGGLWSKDLSNNAIKLNFGYTF